MKQVFAVVAVLCCTAAVSAGPVLLASFDNEIHGPGSAPAEPSVAFLLEIVGATSYAQIGESVFWGEGARGTVDFTPLNEPGFAVANELLTNGTDDEIREGVFWVQGGVLLPHPESTLLQESPDLIGYELTLIRLTVHDVHFAPFQTPNGREGLTVDYSLTYEVYGTPVPEPGSLLCLSGALVTLLGSTITSRNRDYARSGGR